MFTSSLFTNIALLLFDFKRFPYFLPKSQRCHFIIMWCHFKGQLIQWISNFKNAATLNVLKTNGIQFLEQIFEILRWVSESLDILPNVKSRRTDIEIYIYTKSRVMFKPVKQRHFSPRENKVLLGLKNDTEIFFFSLYVFDCKLVRYI